MKDQNQLKAKVSPPARVKHQPPVVFKAHSKEEWDAVIAANEKRDRAWAARHLPKKPA